MNCKCGIEILRNTAFDKSCSNFWVCPECKRVYQKMEDGEYERVKEEEGEEVK